MTPIGNRQLKEDASRLSGGHRWFGAFWQYRQTQEVENVAVTTFTLWWLKVSNSSNDGSNIHRARHQGQVTRDDGESQVGGELTRMVVRRIKRPLLTGPRGAVMEWGDSLVSG